MYPVMLDIVDRRCLVVGGGRIALAKIEGLLAAGARVTVVSPEVVARVADLSDARHLQLERRAYRAGDATGHALVFAATNDMAVNEQVHDDAAAAGIWVNVVDVPHLCTFYMPALVRRGPLEIAVGTSGSAPFAAARLRKMLEQAFGAEWAKWVEAASRLRQTMRAAGVGEREQSARYDAFFAATVSPPRIGVRVPGDDEIDRIAIGAPPEPLDAPGRLGFVSLVGAGPGDPELLTLRAANRLREADVVLYDGLVPCAIVDLAAGAEHVSVGKRAGHPSCAQDAIALRMVAEARLGRRVVRLKSGDPYVLGRGGEEVLDLAREGIPFEVVPGLSAAHSAPAAAGIPVTHRGMASGFVVVSGHGADSYEPILSSLASDSATVVVLMGLRSAGAISGLLLARGWPADTPAAVVLGAWTPEQATWIGDLTGLGAYAPPADAGHLPGTIVIGRTVSLAAQCIAGPG